LKIIVGFVVLFSNWSWHSLIFLIQSKGECGMHGLWFLLLCYAGCFSLHQYDLRWRIAYRQCSMLKHYFILQPFFVESRLYIFWNKINPPSLIVKDLNMNVLKPSLVINELMTSIQMFHNLSNFNINERFVSSTLKAWNYAMACNWFCPFIFLQHLN